MNISETTLISLSDLMIDPELQARSKIDQEHVARLSCTDPKDWPPLVVTPHPDKPGIFAILDGAHRFEAGKKIELPDGKIGHLKQYRCIVIQDGGYVESFGLNADHPLSLSLDDRKAFAQFLKENNPSLSNREIAKRCGLGRRTVDRLFAQNENALASRAPTGAGSSNHVKQFINLLVRAYDSGEASGFFGLGEHRSSAIVEEIQKSKSPKAAEKALHIWTDAVREALEKIQSQKEK